MTTLTHDFLVAIPDGISVDQMSGVLFYTDTGYDIIALITLDGSYSKTIIDQNLYEPRAIVTNPKTGYALLFKCIR